jgi:endonuclease YncB( thermonuclease family)
MGFKTKGFMVAIAFSAIIIPSHSRADFTTRVLSVEEGDKLTISHRGRDQVIHLRDIDCPELKQPYGKQARHVTAAFVGGREVVVRGLQRNRQGRTTAEVFLQDGRNVGYELVREGLAWVRPETPGGQSLADLERVSRAEGKGLWSEPHPVPPWQWKVKKKFRQ